jgi:hypothetical protein
MRFGLTLVISATVVAFDAAPCAAQTRPTSPEELQRELAAGDVITVVPASGQRVSGQLLRQTAAGLEIRPADKRHVRGAGSRDLTIPLDAIHWLERPRDPVRNGVIIGTSTGAAVGGAMFLTAFVIDRNEMDEWAPFYLGATAVCTGIGALVGWTLDAARSKPYLTYYATPGARTNISVRPLGARGLGIGLVVAF